MMMGRNKICNKRKGKTEKRRKEKKEKESRNEKGEDKGKEIFLRLKEEKRYGKKLDKDRDVSEARRRQFIKIIGKEINCEEDGSFENLMQAKEKYC